jgi:hypothetical protein
MSTKPGHQGAHALDRVTKVCADRRPSITGVVGISYQISRDARRNTVRRVLVVSPHRRKFNIDTLGRAEAWRRALALRAEHETRVTGTIAARPVLN